MSIEPKIDQLVESSQEFLTFSLGEEQYGVDILKVKEIRGWETLRELHDVPCYIKGVLDLRLRFSVENIEYKTTTVIIILSTENDNSMMGIVVDAVSDVLSIKQSDMKKAPSMGSKINTDYMLGVVSAEDGMIMLLDSEKLVDKEQLQLSVS